MKLSKFHRQILFYSLAMGGMLFLLKWLELRFLVLTHAFEVYAGIIALIFTSLGIWLALKISKTKIKTEFIELQSANRIDADKAALLNISARESEVLQLIAKGMSNAEIAQTLFVSTNTVKSHVASLFQKLNAARRVQAVEIARQLGIIHSSESMKTSHVGENHPKV